MTEHDESDEKETRSLRRAIDALPREVAPSDGAWSNIHARIEASRVRALNPAQNSNHAPLDHSQPTRTSRSWIRSPLGTALIAASLLVAVTTIVVRKQGAIDVSSGSQYAIDTARAGMTGVFARYDGAATDLATDFARRRARLNPETVAVMDSCLTTIDNAIRETSTALAQAPDNTTIAELLEVTYQQKLDLLRRAAELSEVSP